MREVESGKDQRLADGRKEEGHVLTSNARENGTKEAAGLRRERDRQTALDRMRLFQFKSTQYLDTCEMSEPGQPSVATGISLERIVSSRAQSPQFSYCYQKGSYSLPWLSDPPPLLQRLLTGPETRDSLSRQKNRM